MISHTDNTHCGLHTTNAVIPSSSSVSSENNTRIEKTSPLGKQTVPTGQNQQRWAPKLYIGDLVNHTKVVVKIDSSVVPGNHHHQQQQQAKVQLFSWKGLEFNRAQIQVGRLFGDIPLIFVMIRMNEIWVYHSCELRDKIKWVLFVDKVFVESSMLLFYLKMF